MNFVTEFITQCNGINESMYVCEDQNYVCAYILMMTLLCWLDGFEGRKINKSWKLWSSF